MVSALAAIDLLRDRGTMPTRPIAVGAFAEEEGSRFGLACLGSRLATGATSPGRAARAAGPGRGPLAGRDARRRRRARRWGVPRGWTGSVASWSCTSSRVVTWSTAVRRSVWPPAIWPHGRYRFDFTGAANHAGTTRMEDRSDPMTTFAMTALAAGEQASRSGQRATFGRLDVAPNGTNAIPSRVTAWLDARCESDAEQVRLVGRDRAAGERARRPRRDPARGDRRVGLRRGRLRPGTHRAAACRPDGSPRRRTGHPDGGRPRRRHPRRRRVSRPR